MEKKKNKSKPKGKLHKIFQFQVEHFTLYRKRSPQQKSHKSWRSALITAERHKSDFPSVKTGATWSFIVIRIIQKRSVLFPLLFALRLACKARHRPAGHTKN